MSSAAPPPTLFIAVFPVLFVGGWLLICAYRSATGWSGLAKKYPAPERPAGRAFECDAANFGAALTSGAYYHGIHVVFCEAGVYVCASFLWPFHSPFLIPWKKIARLRKKEILCIEFHSIELHDDPREINLTLSARALDEYGRFKKPAPPSPLAS